MADTNYNSIKALILRAYESILSEPGEKLVTPCDDLLLRRMESLRRRKLSVAIAGEVKAGKSTFINALIGEELLPAECLECTNAVVTLEDSNRRQLRIVFANRHEELIGGDGEHLDRTLITKRLADVCSVREEYRGIPTALLDSYLLKGIKSIPMSELEARSKRPLFGKSAAIEKYVDRFCDLAAIPMRIELSLPLGNYLDSVQIVDTPGVNAVSGLKDKTKESVDAADAVFLVQPITPIESDSFRNFFEDMLVLHGPESLFLVLTKSALQTDLEVSHLLREAQRLYPEIDETNIVAVDSLLRIIKSDLQSKSISEVIQDDAKRRLLVRVYNGDHNSWSNTDILVADLERRSNFQKVEKLFRRHIR